MLAQNDIRKIAKLFTIKGIDVSIRKIAETIGTSHTKLLRIYGSKKNLQTSVLETVFGDFLIYIISHNVKKDADGNWSVRTKPSSEDMYRQGFINCVEYGRTSYASILLTQLLGRPSKIDLLKKSMMGAMKIASGYTMTEWDLFKTPNEGATFWKGITEQGNLDMQTHLMLHISLGLMLGTSALEVLTSIFANCINVETANPQTNSKILTGQVVNFLRLYTTLRDTDQTQVKN